MAGGPPVPPLSRRGRRPSRRALPSTECWHERSRKARVGTGTTARSAAEAVRPPVLVPRGRLAPAHPQTGPGTAPPACSSRAPGEARQVAPERSQDRCRATFAAVRQTSRSPAASWAQDDASIGPTRHMVGLAPRGEGRRRPAARRDRRSRGHGRVAKCFQCQGALPTVARVHACWGWHEASSSKAQIRRSRSGESDRTGARHGRGVRRTTVRLLRAVPPLAGRRSRPTARAAPARGHGARALDKSRVSWPGTRRRRARMPVERSHGTTGPSKQPEVGSTSGMPDPISAPPGRAQLSRAGSYLRSTVANQAGAPSGAKRVRIRSGSTETILQPLPGRNACSSSSWLTGCGPEPGPASRKHST